MTSPRDMAMLGVARRHTLRARCARAQLTLMLVLSVSVASAAWAGPPTEQLKTQIDRVLVVLQDPAFKGLEHREERQAVIRDAMDALMEFREVSRRAVGAVWAGRTPGEREEFVGAFADFMKRAFLGRIDLFNAEKVLYDGERVEGDLATVTTRIERKDGDHVPLGFKMMRGADDRWRIYDVNIDGMSLIDNYRAQFSTVLRRSSFEDLVRRIKSRGAEQK